MTNKEWLLERLQWEDWERFLGHTVRYAQKQIKRRRGASGNGMVLPGGHDANSVASEVVSRVLSGEARLAIGWTVERFKAELERQVNQERGG